MPTYPNASGRRPGCFPKYRRPAQTWRLQFFRRVHRDPFAADKVSEEGSQRLQFDFPRHQLDLSGSTKILKYIDIHVSKFGHTLAITVGDDAAIIAVLINLPVALYESTNRFRDSLRRRSRARLALTNCILAESAGKQR